MRGIMRTAKWLTVATLLFAFLYAIYAFYRHNVFVSWSYCVEARFDKMPPNDKALIDWLRSQPGVVPHTVAIGRFEEGGRLVFVGFIQSRNLAGEPPFPDLNGQVKNLGYTGSDGAFHDSVDRTRTITME
jgi:hypothetical protein